MSMNDHLPVDDELPDTLSSAADDDFEEISSDEVDRVVEALESLAATAESENIRYFLEEATLKIYLLVYGDDEAQSEAA
jgi:predicted neutral ceramidase superfamily lipid hydrolase